MLFRTLTLATCIWLTLMLTGPVAASELTPRQRQADFDQLLALIRSTYSMIGYKHEVLGLDLDKLEATYRGRLSRLKSDEEFYSLIQTFVTEFKDAHFGLQRPSTMSARLGFEVVRADGKAIVSEINAEALPYDRFPFKVGDELTALDDKPVATLVRELLAAHGNGREESAIGLATRLLTGRFGVFGSVPTGPCRVSIKPTGASESATVVVQWMVRGKALPGLSFYSKGANRSPDRATRFIQDQHGSVNAAVCPIAAAFTSPTTAPWSPTGGHPLSTSEFSACIFDSPKGPLGYVRIPSMMPEEGQVAALKEFRRLMKEMWVTKGLIVDVADNPGGSVTYVYGLASMLMDKPVELPLWSGRASRTTLTQSRRWVSSETNPAVKAALQFQVDQIETTLRKGLDMTPFGYSWGIVAQSQDAEVNYTHPIVVLISDQCYSGGDMFPSLLQDNKRAVLFGSNTAGAGGSVGNFGPLSYSGCTMSMTQTIWKRQPTGTFIENVGAKPDVPYDITQDDVAGGYKAFRKAYIDVLLKLIQ